jgi:peptidyl-prolyl cis-trans isomerase SurA
MASAQKRANEALKAAKATKSYEEFGLLAEKVSEDDFRVNMGDHKTVEKEKLPPEFLKMAKAMQVGQVSDMIQSGRFFTFFRLNGHEMPGPVKLEAVKDRLRTDMEKEKHDKLRSALNKRLRAEMQVKEL